MKIKSLASATILLTSMHFSAWSACTFNSIAGNDKRGPYTATLSGMVIKSFNPGDFKLYDVIDKYTGTPVFTNSSQPQPSITCNPLIKTHIMGFGIPTPTPIGNVYPTSIRGIGIRLSDASRIYPFTGTMLYSTSNFSNTYQVTIELIKMGDITAPGVLHGPFLQYTATNSSGEILVYFSLANAVQITPRVPTCQVSTVSATYDLGRVSAQDLRGINTVAPQRTPFNLELNCSGGDPGTSTRAFVSFTDANRPANTGTALSLRDTAPDRPASGVGVQIVRDVNGSEQAVRFGPDSSTPGAANQWFAGTIPRGQRQFVIPLKARYVQTASTIKGGKVSAQARFTVSYQ